MWAFSSGDGSEKDCRAERPMPMPRALVVLLLLPSPQVHCQHTGHSTATQPSSSFSSSLQCFCLPFAVVYVFTSLHFSSLLLSHSPSFILYPSYFRPRVRRRSSTVPIAAAAVVVVRQCRLICLCTVLTVQSASLPVRGGLQSSATNSTATISTPTTSFFSNNNSTTGSTDSRELYTEEEEEVDEEKETCGGRQAHREKEAVSR